MERRRFVQFDLDLTYCYFERKDIIEECNHNNQHTSDICLHVCHLFHGIRVYGFYEEMKIYERHHYIWTDKARKQVV